MGDFAKGLAYSVYNREMKRKEEGHTEVYKLQICGWYGVEAIKHHLIDVGKYPNEP